MPTIVLENKGSLITYNKNGEKYCLGSLMCFPEHGVFDPTHGKVDVTKEEAEAHNKLLDQALIDGLWKAEVGQWGTFYYKQGKGITTFTGVVVASGFNMDRYSETSKTVTFEKGSKKFRGYLRKDQDLIKVKRIK
jgi:hypothetical protein